MEPLTVTHEKIDGVHVLTAPGMDGLFAMHRDFDEAVKSAEEAIPLLMEGNYGLSVKATWNREASGLSEPPPEDAWSSAAARHLVFDVVPTAVRAPSRTPFRAM